LNNQDIVFACSHIRQVYLYRLQELLWIQALYKNQLLQNLLPLNGQIGPSFLHLQVDKLLRLNHSEYNCFLGDKVKV